MADVTRLVLTLLAVINAPVQMDIRYRLWTIKHAMVRLCNYNAEPILAKSECKQ